MHAKTRAELLPCVLPTLNHGDAVGEGLGVADVRVDLRVVEVVESLAPVEDTLLGIGVAEDWNGRRTGKERRRCRPVPPIG